MSRRPVFRFFAVLVLATIFDGTTVGAAVSAAPPGTTSTPSSIPASALEVIALPSLERRVVYRAPGKMEAPHFSPDGGALYFNRNGKIQRLDLTANEPPVMIDTGSATRCINDHGISPDGTQLVISDLAETGKSLMYLLPIAGGAPQRIAVPEPAYWHGWSPDGKTLVYCGAREGNYDIYMIPVAGGKETRLTTAAANDNGPDYSADGQWIYFHSFRTEHVQVWRMHADGSNQEQVTNDGYNNWFPHPSPDGKWIAVLSSKVVPDTGHPPNGEYVLRLIPTAGGEPREIAHFYGANGCFNVPCWSRDSTRLAFASYESGK